MMKLSCDVHSCYCSCVLLCIPLCLYSLSLVHCSRTAHGYRHKRQQQQASSHALLLIVVVVKFVSGWSFVLDLLHTGNLASRKVQVGCFSGLQRRTEAA
jgi:hypothetical protein